MEPTTLATATIAALFTSEAAKAGGKAFGESASKLVSQLLALIRNKFKDSKTEGVLTMAEEQPTESSINLVKTVLVAQIEKDEEFANHLRELLAQSEAEEVIRQRGIDNFKGAGNIEVGDVDQEVIGGESVEQLGVSNVEVEGDAKFGNLTQKRLKP